MLENAFIIYKAERYNINIGKNKTTEVDFVATDMDKTVYYQVSKSIANEETLKREVKSLANINDNYKK